MKCPHASAPASLPKPGTTFDPLGDDVERRAALLANHLRSSEEVLMAGILGYAKRFGYSTVTSTLLEPWRMSIRGLSEPMLRLLDTGRVPPRYQLPPPIGLEAIAEFACVEAQRHRARGVELRMYLELLKYYRDSFVDSVGATDWPTSDKAWADTFLLRFFDHLEILVSHEWAAEGESAHLEELRASNRALTNEKNKFLTIFESLADPSFFIDGRGQLRHVNQAAADAFPHLARAVRYYAGLPAVLDLPPELEGLIEAAQRTHERADRHEVEVRMMTRDGERLFLTAVQTMVDVSGKFEGVVVSARDITERERAVQTQRNMEIQLRQAQKLEALGRLAAGIAHEVNTPVQYLNSNLQFMQDAFQELTTLVASAQTTLDALQRQRPDDEEVARLCEHLRREAELADLDFIQDELPAALEQSRQGVDQVSRTVRAVRAFSQGEVGHRIPTNLNASLELSVAIVRGIFERHATFDLELAPDLPEVEADSAALRQAILGMLINAGEATQKMVGRDAATRGRVVVRTLREDDYVKLEIEDQGRGIPFEIRDRVFDPFFSTKDVGSGRGEGLAFAHRVIVGQHGGGIDFECPAEGGTSFRIRLPLKPQRDRAPALAGG